MQLWKRYNIVYHTGKQKELKLYDFAINLTKYTVASHIFVWLFYDFCYQKMTN